MQAKSFLNRWLKVLHTRSRDRGTSPLRSALLLCLLVVPLLVPGAPAGNVASAATGDNAISFGGDGYVEVLYSPSLSPTTGITIEGWVKRSETERLETLVGNGMDDSYWFGFSATGKLYFTPDGLGGMVEGTSVVSAERWTHVAVTYDGLTRCYYINGVLDTVTTEDARPLGQAPNGQELGIGHDVGNTPPPYFFLGKMDNVRIWSTARTGAQVRDGMFQPVGTDVNARALVAEWMFNGDATDSTGAHDGTVHGALTLFTNEGAIPRNIRIPQVSVTPSLDGFCHTSEYGSATQVTVDGTPIWLLHTTTDLWVCFDNLHGSEYQWASVYLDAGHTRLDPAQPEHLRLTVYDDDTTGAQVGTGDGVYIDTTSADGLWGGKYLVDSSGSPLIEYRAEFRIDDDLVGGWEHVIGLALTKSTGARGGTRVWPALGVTFWPSTWSNAILSGAGSPRTFTGKTVYQPRDFMADPVGVAGVRVELIGSDPAGSEAVVAVAETNPNGSFWVSSSDDYTEHRIEIGDLPRGYLYGTAEADPPGVALDSRTIDYGAVPAGTYANNVFTLGEFLNYAVHTENGPYFLIVATQHVIDHGALAEFVLYKQRLGFEVEVISVETIDLTVSGANRMERIRALERDRLFTYGPDRFRYVMLVGAKDRIPFAQITPWFHGRDSNGVADLDKCLDTDDTKFKFTDWYYADLLSNFDSNGNGCLLDGFVHSSSELAEIAPYGYIPDNRPMFQPTVAVGRIPFNNRFAVRDALSNIMRFEQQSEEFKRRTLMAMSYYWIKGQFWSPLHDAQGSYTNCPPEKDSGAEGVSRICQGSTEDAAVFAEGMKANFLNPQGYVSTILYEGVKVPGASVVVSPQPLEYQNVLAALEATTHGMVNFGGHGSHEGVYRAHWNELNGNGIVDSPTEPLPSFGDKSKNEIGGGAFIDSAGLQTLTPDEDHGSVYITAACSTSDPTKNSLGVQALQYGHAVAWVGALNVVSVIAPVDEGVTERLLGEDLRLGDAVWQTLSSRASHASRKVWTKSANWATTLYGDPTLSYWGNPGGQSTLAAWPMARYDALGSGHNPLIGPEVPKVTWTYNATAPSALPLPPSPVLSNNGEVIVAHGSAVDVLRNGTLYQRLNLSHAVYGTPAIAADGTIYALDVNGWLYAFPYQKLLFWFNGSIINVPLRELRWMAHLGSAPSTSPVVGADGFIAVGGWDRIVLIRPDGKKVGQATGVGQPIGGLAVDANRAVYATTVANGLVKVDFFCPDGPCIQYSVLPGNTPPLLAHGAVYYGRTNGYVAKLSTEFGFETEFQADGQITAGPVTGPYGQILVGTANGTLYSLTEDLALRWQRSVGPAVTSVPASSFDAVYLVSGDEMLAYHPYSGVPLWSRNLGSGVGSGSVAVGYGRELYAQTSSGKIVAVGEGWTNTPALFAVTMFKQATRSVARAEWAPTAPVTTTLSSAVAQGTSLGFLLQRSDGGEWEDLAILPPGTTVFTDSSVISGTAYAYRLQALDSEGNDSEFLPALEIVQSLPALPQKPILDAVTTEAADALGLTWHSPGSDLVSAYRVERGPSASGPFTTALQVGSGMTATTDAGLAPDTTYFYRVFAVNGAGESPPSDVLSGTTRMLTLAAPENVSATLSVSGYVQISWSPGPPGATAVVEYGEGTQEGYLPLGTADAAGPYSHYPGEPNVYTYRVKFVQGNAESPYTESGLVILKEYDIFLPLVLRNTGTQ